VTLLDPLVAAARGVPGAGAFARRGPGLALAAALAVAATGLAFLPAVAASGLSALTLAIVLGMIAGNTIGARLPVAVDPGIDFAKKNLLRLGIVLYGARLTFQDIAHVGIAGIVVDALVLTSTFGLACFIGTRFFGLDRKAAMLIGAGSAICGAAAVMATEPIVRARSEQVAVAVATVVVFGTVSMFAYPLLAHALALSPQAYGLYAGSTIHEVAQVVAAGRAITPEAADTAVIAKMVRVMMLAPFLVALSAWVARRPNTDDAAVGLPPAPIVVPWFALLFVVMAGVHSTGLLPKPLVDTTIDVDTFVLAMAMAALGLTTRVSAIRTAGAKPLLLALVLFGWLVVGGLAINLGVSRVLG
jgi:uncharacterized integral membrane protein (TIGR00698 family)